MDNDDQNSGATKECMTGSDNGATERFYGRVKENWELDYSGLHNTTMFRVRWAKNVERKPDFHYHDYTRRQERYRECYRKKQAMGTR